MKEKIYTIPVNEAYEAEVDCPLCFLEKKLENDAVEYALGAAMMEPDYRIISNEKGYCNRHFEKMFEKPNKLSLGLVLDTHLAEIEKKLNGIKTAVDEMSKSKGGIFKKKTSKEDFSVIAHSLDDIKNSCVVCDKIDKTMERYVDVLFYLWDNDENFQNKFKSSHGFCIKHLEMVVSDAPKYLGLNKALEFLKELMEIEENDISKLREDIHKFTLKFDYRNKDMEWGTAQDSPFRTIEKLVGSIEGEKNNE